MGSENITAGMIVVENAKFCKKHYRHFKIKGNDGPDDYQAMEEALRRRLSHVGESDDESFGVLPDLILLDVCLPFENGYHICEKLREQRKTPVIFVTGRDTAEDELRSILAGGADFITKPYDTMILLEKIKRAIHLSDPQTFREISKNGYTLDMHLSLLKKDGKEIELTRNEFRILYYFFMNDDRVIGREELLEKLWNDKYYLDENVLTVNIARLRKKAAEIGIDDLLKTVRGAGYQL